MPVDCNHLLTHLQCLSILLESAIFSFSSVQTGCVREILARSALDATTQPPVESEPMFTINISLLVNFSTWRRDGFDLTIITMANVFKYIFAIVPRLVSIFNRNERQKLKVKIRRYILEDNFVSF